MANDASARWWARGSSAETAADKRLYIEVGYVPVRCRTCDTEVLVKKNSEQQTSVQWLSDPVSTCPEFTAAVAAGERSAQRLACSKLKASIVDAVKKGTVVVPDV